jgi:hypothetical protein
MRWRLVKSEREKTSVIILFRKLKKKKKEAKMKMRAVTKYTILCVCESNLICKTKLNPKNLFNLLATYFDL